MISRESLDALRAGTRSIEDLTPREFEEAVVSLILELEGVEATDASVVRDEHHFVDVTIERRVGTHLLLDFVEAKRTRPELPLDRVAKSFLGALRFRPLSLTIATGTGLQPQAVDYAGYFFPHGTPEVRIWTVTDMIAGDTARRISGGSNTGRKPALFTVQDWQIWRYTTFTAQPMATKDGTASKLELDPLSDIVLRLYCAFPQSVPPQAVEASFSAEGVDLREHDRHVTGNQARFDVLIRPTGLGRPVQRIRIDVAHKRTQQAQSVLLVPFTFADDERVLPPFRQDLTRNWVRSVTAPDGPRLVFVRGEAGVGKTYFCESVSRALQTEYGFEPFHFAIDQLDAGLFHRVFMALALPRTQVPESLESIHKEIVDTLLTETVKAAGLARGATALDHLVNENEFDLLVESVAHFTAKRARPVVLVLTNGQRLAPEMIRGLRGFVAALETHGWDNVRILCEFRDTPDERNPAVEAMADEMMADRKGNAATVKLEPIERRELVTGLASVFPYDEAPWIATTLMEKTRGNPLFLDNLLRLFVSRGVLRRIAPTPGVAGPALRVVEPAVFREALDRVPDPVAAILGQRLAYYDERDFARGHGGRLVSRVLGLAALLGLEIDPRVPRALGLAEHEAAHLLDALVQANILTRALSGGAVMFAHDLQRIAARERYASLSDRDDGDATALLRHLAGDQARAHHDRGVVLGFFRRDADAVTAFDAGYEMANQEPQDFIMQRLCLRELEALYERVAAPDTFTVARHLHVLKRLGWAEQNAGSALQGTRAFEKALTILENPEFDLEVMSPDVVALERSRFAQALFGETVYSNDLAGAPRHGVEALRNVPDFGDWGRIMNRLILFCHLADLPGHGKAAADLALDFACYSDDPEVGAVLCTDIGDLYLLGNPAYSFELRSLGHQIAHSKRQQINNDVCLFVSRYYAQGVIDKDALDYVEREAKRHGVHAVLGRLSLLRGLLCMIENQPAIARNHFSFARQQAGLHGHSLLAILADHNLMLLDLIDDDRNAAARRAGTIAEFCGRHHATAVDAEAGAEAVLDAARRRAAVLRRRDHGCVSRPLRRPPEAPAVTSWVPFLARTLDRLGNDRLGFETALPARLLTSAARTALDGLAAAAGPHVLAVDGVPVVLAVK